MKVLQTEPSVERSELEKVYSAITFNQDLRDQSKSFANSNQLEELDASRHIDPIYHKIKKFSNQHSSKNVLDNTLSLDVKHKMNNDIV